MRVVCAWCGAVQSEGPGPISHGVCASCAALFERAYLRALEQRYRRRGRVRRQERASAPLPGFGEEAELPGGEQRAGEVTTAAVR